VSYVRTFIHTVVDDLLFRLEVLRRAIEGAFYEQTITPLHVVPLERILDALTAEFAVKREFQSRYSFKRSASTVRAVHDTLGDMLAALVPPGLDVFSAQQLMAGDALLSRVGVFEANGANNFKKVAFILSEESLRISWCRCLIRLFQLGFLQ